MSYFFPVPGNPSGTAPTGNYIGRLITGTSSGISVLNGAPRTPSTTSISLPTGTWLINGYGQYGTSNSTSFSLIGQTYYNVSTSAEFGPLVIMDRASNTTDAPRVPMAGFVITVPANTTWNIGMSINAAYVSGSVTFSAILNAVRLA